MTTLPELDDRFDVIAKLGEGGMGCVYKVRHRDLDEVQIVKTLQAHLSSNEGLRTRFVNEARRGMKLRHPHIAGVHDFKVCADGTGYIVMEYVSGHNLRDLLATKGPLSLHLTGVIAMQTLDALAYLHGEKFVHRDISPDNLMLTKTKDGRPFVKLIDLGISKSLESGQTMTATGAFIGKVQYAAPEQFGGHDIDGRADLYSFGVVLYKLLTNEDPFTGDNYREVIAAHLFKEPRPFPATIPENVQRVILRALEKDPANRYADALEFRAAVEEAFGIDDERPTLGEVRRTMPARLPETTEVVTQLDTTVADATVADATVADQTVVEQPVTRPRRIARIALIALAAAIVLFGALLAWQRYTAAQLARYGKFYAVVIGESQYRKLESLPTAVDDARAVAELLESKYGFEVTRLENAPSRAILTALQSTEKRMTNADNLLVFYAGHGTLLNDKGYWQPVDADLDMTNWISPALIKDVLVDNPARRTLIVADSCYSGALVRGALNAPAAKDRIDKRSRLVISSGGNAPVIDSADGQHSIFTRALLDVLGDAGRKPLDVQQLFVPIRDRVVDAARRAGSEQSPELSVIAEVGDEGGSFYFVPRAKR